MSAGPGEDVGGALVTGDGAVFNPGVAEGDAVGRGHAAVEAELGAEVGGTGEVDGGVGGASEGAAVDGEKFAAGGFALGAGGDADDEVDPLAGDVGEGGGMDFRLIAGEAVGEAVDAALDARAILVEGDGGDRAAVIAVGGFELEDVVEGGSGGEAGVGAEVEGVFEGLFDLLVTEADDALGFGALAVGAGGVGAVAIPPAGAGGVGGDGVGVFVAECVAEHGSAFVDVVFEGVAGLESVGVGEVEDGGFFEAFEAGLVLDDDRGCGAGERGNGRCDGEGKEQGDAGAHVSSGTDSGLGIGWEALPNLLTGF